MIQRCNMMVGSLILAVLIMSSATAQTSSDPNWNAVDLSLSAGKGRAAGALSVMRMHRIVKAIPNLRLGYGLRLTGFVAANKMYVTAPAKLTSPVQNLGTIFSETIEKNIDTVTTATTITNSLNAAIYIEYSLTSKLDAGFTIDAAGFSFGPKENYNVISSVFDPNQSPVVSGSPTRLNLLLTSDNDIGSLNSEFYVRYWIGGRSAIRLGYTFLFSEITLDEKLSFDMGRIMNDRYRYKASMIMIGFTFKAFD